MNDKEQVLSDVKGLLDALEPCKPLVRFLPFRRGGGAILRVKCDREPGHSGYCRTPWGFEWKVTERR